MNTNNSKHMEGHSPLLDLLYLMDLTIIFEKINLEFFFHFMS